MTQSNTLKAQDPLSMFCHWEATKPSDVYLRQPVQGCWQEYSWGEVGDQARRIASAIKALDKRPDQTRPPRVSILSKNCAHWLMADLAVMMSGRSLAPAFTSMTAEDVLYILEHSGADVLFVGETENWDQVSKVIPAYITVIALPFAQVSGAHYQWHELLAAHQPLLGDVSRNADDEITTIYTSGSTGRPKGVMYDFKGAGHITHNLSKTFRMQQDDRFISYLPLAHGFERAAVAFMSMYAGCTVGFNEQQSTFADDMRFVKPTVFQCVPRLWAKFREGVLANCGGQEKLDALLSNPSRCEATKNMIQTGLGLDTGRFLITGSAPTPKPLHSWFEALDMPLCEIYGQSEILSGTCNRPWDRKPGTLGKPTEATQVKISSEGEILIKAEAVMTGYLNDPEKTAETLRDGWVHTGDMGEIDAEGFLSITGRLKEIFKTAKGKYVAPVPIEGEFSSLPIVEQVCLMGNGLAQTVLLIQLSEVGQLMASAEQEDILNRHILRVNASLGAHARIASALIASEPWTPGNGLVTHTLKIKRSALEKRYASMAEDTFMCGASVGKPLLVRESIAAYQAAVTS